MTERIQFSLNNTEYFTILSSTVQLDNNNMFHICPRNESIMQTGNASTQNVKVSKNG